MSPFAIVLHSIRTSRKLSQSDLAQLVGCEQSYISALEVGLKGPPTVEFVDRLLGALSLTQQEQDALRDGFVRSNRKLVLPTNASPEAYRVVNLLRARLNVLSPDMLRFVEHVLAFEGIASCSDATPYQAREEIRMSP